MSVINCKPITYYNIHSFISSLLELASIVFNKIKKTYTWNVARQVDNITVCFEIVCVCQCA